VAVSERVSFYLPSASRSPHCTELHRAAVWKNVSENFSVSRLPATNEIRAKNFFFTESLSLSLSLSLYFSLFLPLFFRDLSDLSTNVS